MLPEIEAVRSPVPVRSMTPEVATKDEPADVPAYIETFAAVAVLVVTTCRWTVVIVPLAAAVYPAAK
jgi:hypothetical protein